MMPPLLLGPPMMKCRRRARRERAPGSVSHGWPAQAAGARLVHGDDHLVAADAPTPRLASTSPTADDESGRLGQSRRRGRRARGFTPHCGRRNQRRELRGRDTRQRHAVASQPPSRRFTALSRWRSGVHLVDAEPAAPDLSLSGGARRPPEDPEPCRAQPEQLGQRSHGVDGVPCARQRLPSATARAFPAWAVARVSIHVSARIDARIRRDREQTVHRAAQTNARHCVTSRAHGRVTATSARASRRRRPRRRLPPPRQRCAPRVRCSSARANSPPCPSKATAFMSVGPYPRRWRPRAVACHRRISLRLARELRAPLHAIVAPTLRRAFTLATLPRAFRQDSTTARWSDLTGMTSCSGRQACG